MASRNKTLFSMATQTSIVPMGGCAVPIINSEKPLPGCKAPVDMLPMLYILSRLRSLRTLTAKLSGVSTKSTGKIVPPPYFGHGQCKKK